MLIVGIVIFGLVLVLFCFGLSMVLIMIFIQL